MACKCGHDYTNHDWNRDDRSRYACKGITTFIGRKKGIPHYHTISCSCKEYQKNTTSRLKSENKN